MNFFCYLPISKIRVRVWLGFSIRVSVRFRLGFIISVRVRVQKFRVRVQI